MYNGSCRARTPTYRSNNVTAITVQIEDDLAETLRRLAEAHWRILRAETSCNFFWGESWLPRCHRDLDEAWAHLKQAEELIS